MGISIRNIETKDKEIYMQMAEEFYATDAVMHPISKENFEKTFEEVFRSKDYAECHIFVYDDNIAGYGLLAKTFSQEAGGKVCWIEELYVKPEFRSKGIVKSYFSYIFDKYKDVKRFRLEVESDNEAAVRLYLSQGFDFMDYSSMYKEVI